MTDNKPTGRVICDVLPLEIFDALRGIGLEFGEAELRVRCGGTPSFHNCLMELRFQSQRADLLITEVRSPRLLLWFVKSVRRYAPELPILLLGKVQPSEVVEMLEANSQYFSEDKPDRLCFLRGTIVLTENRSHIVSDRISRLHKAEVDLAELVASGYTSLEIAQRIESSLRTTSGRIYMTCRKLFGKGEF